MPLSAADGALGLEAALGLIAAIYLRGAHRARIATWRRGAFLGALATLGLALASPLDELADRLLSAHMLQHLLLMLAAAPLLVAGRPFRAIPRMLPVRMRRTLARAMRRPIGIALHEGVARPAVAWILFCGALAFWHMPGIYRWARAAENRHMFMHLCLLASGWVFWEVVRRVDTPRGLDYGSTILYVLGAALVTGLPGALLTFAGHLVYGGSSTAVLPFGLTPLGDQQLAGLLMWIPMDLMLFGVAAWLFARWLSRMPASSPPRSRRGRALYRV